MTTFNDYQHEAKQYLLDSVTEHDRMAYLVAGLCGEAGEVAEKYKRTLRGEHIKRRDIAHELGDVLWYITLLAEHLDMSLGSVAVLNLYKLADRAQRGTVVGTGDDR